jgi:transposase InsO family protein
MDRHQRDTNRVSSVGHSRTAHSAQRTIATFGVPEGMSTDGGPEFKSSKLDSFLTTWGVRHCLSSAYNPQSNGHAEAAVKSAKRLLHQNTGPGRTLDTDKML